MSAAEPQTFTMSADLHAETWVATHAGLRRSRNEDSFLSRADAGLWVVADGAGGHSGGEAASRAVIDAMSEIPTGLGNEQMLAAVQRALQRTHDQLRTPNSETSGGATTVVLLVARGDRITCLWAGDSRAYRWRNNELVLLTRDHSLVQEMVTAGRISVRETRNHPARHVITRAVGAHCEVLNLDRTNECISQGDVYLLCSDGIPVVLEDSDIARCFSVSIAGAADELVAAALDRGAPDNVTAVVVRLSGSRS